ncbi:MAG: hypothetical protein M3N91_01020 [Pseudomonadota bacterium]|nr:hypothetical protein [Pseudomonadota bacterium]
MNARQVAAPIEAPVRFGGVKEAGTLRGVIIGGIAVDETIGDDLVDDLLFKVLG